MNLKISGIKSWLRLSLGELKEKVKLGLKFTVKLLGKNSLDRSASISMLEDYVVYQKQHNPVDIPALKSINGLSNSHFTGYSVSFYPDYVWDVKIDDKIKSLDIGRSGITLINQKDLLDLDFGTTAGLLEVPYKINPLKFPVVIAPWSHFWGSYYDFIIFVLAKLVRIENAIDKQLWQEAKICYPLFGTAFEEEFLRKLDIDQSSIINTRNWTTKIETERVFLANNQNWFTPSPYDLALLRSRFCPDSKGSPEKRLYISRSGRRRVQNEAEVRELLQQFGFEIVEDIARSVDEQIRLFSEASVVVGPHGGGLTNLLWCNPGTKVIEFFNSAYASHYYYYICKILDLEYYYMVEQINIPNHWSQTAVDITVDVKELKMKLQEIIR